MLLPFDIRRWRKRQDNEQCNKQLSYNYEWPLPRERCLCEFIHLFIHLYFYFFSPQHVSFFLLAMTQTCTHWRWFSKAKVNTNIRFYSRPTMTQCYHLIELYLHDTCSITSCQLKRSFICIIKYSVDWGTVSLIRYLNTYCSTIYLDNTFLYYYSFESIINIGIYQTTYCSIQRNLYLPVYKYKFI